MSRIFSVPFSSVYPPYATKVEKKSLSQAELIAWLTGFDEIARGKKMESILRG